MLLGAAGAAVLGYWDEGGMLLFLFTLSSTLESFAMGRTRRAVKSLVAMRPDEATVLREGRHERVAVEEVRVGERIVIRPGERVPLDGRVEEGEADVDESALTGEAVPRGKAPGSMLMAGSINLDGSLVAEVMRPASESTLTRIVDLVEKAHEARAPTQRVFESFARYYISRRALRILYGNLFFASAVIMVLVTLAITGGLALPVGVAAHEGSTLLVVLNGLRLLWWKPR